MSTQHLTLTALLVVTLLGPAMIQPTPAISTPTVSASSILFVENAGQRNVR